MPILPVFTENDYDRDQILKNLNMYFSDHLDIFPVNIATRDSLPHTPKAVVVNITSNKIVDKYFPFSYPIYARRRVNGYNLEQLIELPAGTRAVVANKPREIACEMREDLISLGITHLDLLPYWPDADLDIDDVDTVIYPGFRNYCPEHKKRYIDIGYRSISPATLAEIIKIYDLPVDCVDFSHKDHMKLIVDGLYKIHGALQDAETLRKNFQQACFLSASALINIDKNGTVVVFNPAAERLMGLKSCQVVGKDYRDCLRAFEPLHSIAARQSETVEELIYIRKHPVLVTMNLIDIEQNRHRFLSLTPVEALQGTEEKARASMHRRGFVAKHTFDDLKGSSPRLLETLETARFYAQSDATVLLSGESGTGKELFAQAIHNASSRAGGPFVGVNFAAIAENLIESELFGYEEGAFTGASKGGKQGLFRTAHRGTIFLDEIGDISPSMQSRLLRVLEEREVMPVGSTHVIPIDVRIICATNKDLIGMIEQGAFREDLYYRLKMFPLEIPPLRDRWEDIPFLLDFMAGGEKYRLLPKGIRERLLEYPWPGNIRELKAIAQYLSMLGGALPETPEGVAAVERMIEIFLTQRASKSPDAVGSHLPDDEAALLKCIHLLSRQNRSAGRYSLAKHPMLATYRLTESIIKTKLKRLEAKGLIQSGKTRQGPSLTPAGVGLVRGLTRLEERQ